MKYYFQCPRCSNDEQFFVPDERTTDLTTSLFLVGGFFGTLLSLDYFSHRI